MNEATVRGHILEPLLAALGYAWGTDLNIVREHTLKYPFQQLGRKSKNDRPIQGRPDYVLDCRGVARWVLEAKAEGKPLHLDEADQSYSYAVHPEVRALYYCLSDGKIFRVYSLISENVNAPVLEVLLVEADTAISVLKAFFSRESLERRAQAILAPVAPNTLLRQITGGSIVYDFADAEFLNPHELPSDIEIRPEAIRNMVVGLIYPIEHGTIHYGDNAIEVDVTVGGRDINDITHMDQFGLRDMKFIAVERRLSEDPSRPTHLQTTQSASVEAGTSLKSSIAVIESIPNDIAYTTTTDVWIWKDARRALGRFSQTSIVEQSMGGFVIKVLLTIGGEVSLSLSN